MRLQIVVLSWVIQYCRIALLCFCVAACGNSPVENRARTSQSDSSTNQNRAAGESISTNQVFNDKAELEQESEPTSLAKVTQPLRVGSEQYSAIKLSEDKFENNNWEERWHLESSDASVSVVGGQLHTDVPQGGTGLNLWYKGYNQGEFPKDVLIRFKAKSLIGGDKWLQIIMLNTNVRRADNSEYLLGTFNGKDSDYQNNLRMYRTSFTRDALVLRVTPPRTNLVFENKRIVVETNKEFEFVVAVHNGRIKGYIDQVKLFDVAHDHPQYKTPFEGGKVGIRTNKSKIVWDDFEFYELLP